MQTGMDSVISKTRLTAYDAGRLLVQNMIDNTISQKTNPLPAEVQAFLGSSLSISDTEILNRFNSLLVYIAQFRSVSDTHRLRLTAFFSNAITLLQDAIAIEKLMNYMESIAPDSMKKAYTSAEKPDFIGTGLDSFIPEIYPEASDVRGNLAEDFKLAQQSYYFISAYNTSIDLIKDEINISDLTAIQIPEDAYISFLQSYNNTIQDLKRTLLNSKVAFSKQRLEVLEEFFPKFNSADIKVDPERIAAARREIKSLSCFNTNEGRLADILLTVP